MTHAHIANPSKARSVANHNREKQPESSAYPVSAYQYTYYRRVTSVVRRYTIGPNSARSRGGSKCVHLPVSMLVVNEADAQQTRAA